MAEIGILAKVTFKTPSISIMIYSDSYHFWTVYCINNHSQHSNNIFNEIYTFSTFSSSIHQFQVFHISHFNLFDFRTRKCEKLCYYIFIDFLFFRKEVVAFAVSAYILVNDKDKLLSVLQKFLKYCSSVLISELLWLLNFKVQLILSWILYFKV